MPKNIIIAEIKSIALKKSPVSKNKLFINIIPPKKILNEKIIGTPNIPASRRIAAHKSNSPSILTIIFADAARHLSILLPINL